MERVSIVARNQTRIHKAATTPFITNLQLLTVRTAGSTSDEEACLTARRWRKGFPMRPRAICWALDRRERHNNG